MRTNSPINIAGLIAGMAIAFAGCGQVTTAVAPTSEEKRVDAMLSMQEDKLLQQLHQRLDIAAEIDRFTNETAKLNAETEKLIALAQNCQARRDAYDAGADVMLCEDLQAHPAGQPAPPSASR